YYERSAQIPSHLSLLAGPTVAGGVLLQQMPGSDELDEDDWRRLGMLAATLRPEDIRDGVGINLLSQLFAGDDLRVFAARDAVFRCRCTRERTEDVLRMLGEQEATESVQADGVVDVTCEYCGRNRRFDEIDIKRQFAPAGPSSGRLH
ncbi:MAG: Hsp33 family molecular chaperone HslO, partial [Woeseia sp.]